MMMTQLMSSALIQGQFVHNFHQEADSPAETRQHLSEHLEQTLIPFEVLSRTLLPSSLRCGRHESELQTSTPQTFCHTKGSPLYNQMAFKDMNKLLDSLKPFRYREVLQQRFTATVQ
jgi:hypothetical protein